MSLGARIYATLRGDKVIWMILAVLAMFSILAVYSATSSMAYRLRGGDTEAYLMGHGIKLIGGLFLCYLAYLMHYMRFNKAAPYLMVIAIPLLVLTLALGEDINQARRWLEIPYVGINFQTSDLAKLALILFVAREITRHKDYIKDLQKAFMPIIMPILLVCGLIAPADMSTALLLLGTCLLMMFIGRVSLKYIGLLILLWIVVFAFLIILGEMGLEVVRADTWMSRFADFNPMGEGIYEVEQAKIAIANGELFGLGPGNSVQRNFLPASHADYIYAIICEEYGLIGGFIILGLYVLLLFRTATLVTKSEKSFGAMAAMGLTILLVLQALINMAVSVNLVPVTGLPLPMVSWGGTSLLFTCVFFGIILSVSKFIESGRLGGDLATAKSSSKGKSETSKDQKQDQKGEQQKGQDGDGQHKRHDGGGYRKGGGGDRRDGGGYKGGNRGGGQGGGGYRGGGGNRGGGNRGGGGGYRGGGGNRGGGNRGGGGYRGGGGGNRGGGNRGGGGGGYRSGGGGNRNN